MNTREMEEIKREMEQTSIIRPTKSIFLRFIIGTLLILTAIGALGVAFFGSTPDEVACVNPMNNSIPTFFAYCTMLLFLPGLVCIFVKSIRRPLLIITCIVLILFLIMVMFNAALNGIAYHFAKDKKAEERPCVITFHKGHHDKSVADDRMEGVDDYILDFRYLDNQEEDEIAQSIPLKYYNNLYEGDTCVAYVKEGILGIKFVTDIKCVKRKRQAVDDEDSKDDDEDGEEDEEDEDFKD